ncbi:MAG: glycyl-radical enzyme activating protein [Treponema sp.]|nr:glycyl-radical enzyme activating protein [Treponema sp.]
MKGLISRIQRYSTKDGPGIRSTVFAVGCNLCCKWCSNPELVDERPKILYHAERCFRCGACAALSGGTIKLGSRGCIIDRKKCNNLEECAAVCSYDAYEYIGKIIDPEELAAKLMRDKAFYDRSCGGVTYSGGEPALQADFFLETTKLLKEESIHVALDTAGHIPWESLSPLVEAVDLILYDIKVFDNLLHEKYVKAGNSLILENARKIAELEKPMIVRMILVPGVNDSEEEVQNRLDFIHELGRAVIRLDILKYHRLGAGKYFCLGSQEPMGDIPECTDEYAGLILQKARSMGFAVTVGG